MGLRTWFRRQLAIARHGRRAYDAAKWNRFTADFLASGNSADAEIRGSLKVLRNRSRALVRDNPYARQAKRTTQINVVGARGIQMQPQVLRPDGSEKDERRNAALLAAWNHWCRADSCDVTGRLSFHGIELSIVGALPESGEIGIRLVRQPMGRSKVPLSLELIEADQIDDEYTGLSDRPKHYWRMGVELNEWGRPTRYAILRKHPGDVEFTNYIGSNEKHLFIDAADFIHVFMPERVGQTRGVPWFASVITTSWNLGKYEEAHWTRKRVQANSLGWIQTPEPETFGSTNPDGTPALEDSKRLWNTEPGSYNFLLPGETAIPPDFGPDDGQYEAVVRPLARRFAAGYGCSYETLSRDFSDTNYSSSRLSILEDRDHWRVIQSVLIQQVHQRVFEEWLAAAEYLLVNGCSNVMLCERGLRSFDKSVRNLLDLGGVAVAKQETHLPVLVDPSHAAGKRSLVLPLAKAALGAGADGLVIEAHPNPNEAYSDAAQQLPSATFKQTLDELATWIALARASR